MLADHKPGLERERARVERCGGRVEMQRCWRIITTARGTNTGLAVSRSLGDLDFKEPSMCGSVASAAVLPSLQCAALPAQDCSTRPAMLYCVFSSALTPKHLACRMSTPVCWIKARPGMTG